ncbi:MAG: glycosyltransferase family 2 protein [Acholeplasmataceae bacterium]
MTLFEISLVVLGVFALGFVYLLLAIAAQKYQNHRTSVKHGWARDYIFAKYFDYEEIKRPTSNRFFFDAFIEAENQVLIEPDVRKRIVIDLMLTRFCKKQFKNIRSRHVNKRKIASFYLSALQENIAYDALKKQLIKEKNESVKFYLIYAIKKSFDQDIVTYIVTTLEGASAIYRKWIYTIISNNFNLMKPYLLIYEADYTSEIRELMLFLAKKHTDPFLKDYALAVFDNNFDNFEVQRLALASLAQTHPDLVAQKKYFSHPSKDIKSFAIAASANIISTEMVDFLLNSMDGSQLDKQGVNALSRITFESKKILMYVLESYPKYKQKTHIRHAIVRVLSHRIDYLMLKLMSDDYDYILNIIEDILTLHITEDLIDFMNHNKNKVLEDKVLNLIKKSMIQDQFMMDEFTVYLSQDILIKMGMIKKTPPMAIREKAPVEKYKIIWVIQYLTLGLLFMPLLFVIRNFRVLISGYPLWYELFIVEINFYLVFYFLFLNSVYLILLLFSLRGAKERLDLWHIKKQTLLFEHDLLPSISIIAPAYNEEKSIIESITSLLNLKYPKYEVIVVNDGSKDQTIDVLIKHFDLERKHPFFNQPISTRGLRGVYVNKHIPNLIVIDKVNGGKADALNMGINVAKSDYVCGIDADSLLEEDALLKLISVTLDHATPHIALGGNIVPVNGCVVDQGKIEHRGLGKKQLVRFQSLEYLRAFTSGRIGWSKIKSLLIVSGAFGLFERKALIQTGGYLTISGKLKKDTVGEDMELVVRLTYQALEKKEPYRVEYVHHANCYTELPSDLNSLLKQRNRWQRGLIDILSYHRRMLFNPRYKQPGLIAFPYFFLFEMIGPFIEAIGLLAIVLGAILGLLNLPIFILLFTAGIGYGIIISLFSLLIAEKRIAFYSNKETFILVLYAIIENFGYRQIISMHRAISTLKSLRESGAWGSQKRQGFQTKK